MANNNFASDGFRQLFIALNKNMTSGVLLKIIKAFSFT